MMMFLSFAAAIAVVFLGWNLYQRLSADRITEIIERRRPSSRLVSRGEYVDGNRHLDVALAITSSAFFYENHDMQGSLDLDRIREIEYDSDLATGVSVPAGQVLRLRSGSQTFEFVLLPESLDQWHKLMPARSGAPVAPAHATA